MAAAALAGCSGTQARLYMLIPLTTGTTTTRRPDSRSVGVQPVVMPEYLDRSEIVAYAGPHELSANRDDRWAERLPTNVTRVLAENLSILLGTDHVYVLPSREPERPDYEVAVEFDRFERSASGESVLDAHWLVRDAASQKVVVRNRTRLATRIPNDSYGALVASMNENLSNLSHDIAAVIANLPRKGGGRAGS